MILIRMDRIFKRNKLFRIDLEELVMLLKDNFTDYLRGKSSEN